MQFRRVDGTMNVAAREQAIAEFKEKPNVAVMLMSLKAAALGLNLTAANHVVLLDLWYALAELCCAPAFLAVVLTSFYSCQLFCMAGGIQQ